MALRTQPPGDDGAAGAAMGTGGGWWWWFTTTSYQWRSARASSRPACAPSAPSLKPAEANGPSQSASAVTSAAGRGVHGTHLKLTLHHAASCHIMPHGTHLKVTLHHATIMPHHATRHPLEG